VVSPESEGDIPIKVLFIAPDFSLGIPRLKPRVINLSRKSLVACLEQKPLHS
jgi:hypothetical protein